MLHVISRISLFGSKPTISWQEMSVSDLVEPFFNQTVKRMQNPQLDLDIGESLCVPLTPIIEPTCFIFHLGRCGSTLLSNMLKQLDDTVVISEPGPINSCLLSPSFWQQHFPDDHWIQARDSILKTVVQSYSQLASAYGSPGSRYYIKFTSWNLASLSIFQRLWPSVPIVFIYRNPLEVLLSYLRKEPGWHIFRNNPQFMSSTIGFDTVTACPPREEFYARIIGNLLQTALNNKDKLYLLDYADIKNHGLEIVMQACSRRFSDQETHRANTITRYYSKTTEMKTFEGDTNKEECDVAQLLEAKALCEKWAAQSYKSLVLT